MSRIFVLLLSIAAASQAGAQAPAAATPAGGGCAVVVDRLPPPEPERPTPQQSADVFWNKVNDAISAAIHEALVADHRVFLLEIPFKDSAQAAQLTFVEVGLRGCDAAIQLSHNVDEDAKGPFFEFTVALFTLENLRPAAGGQVGTAKELYSKRYRFVRNAEVLRTFRISQFAGSVAGDLRSSGVINQMRK